MAIPAVTLSDSIKVGEEVHNDVYIDSDDEYYYIRFPEEGRVEKVRRQRRDIGEPIIDTDADLRSRLLKRFESNKAMAERKAEEAAAKPPVNSPTKPWRNPPSSKNAAFSTRTSALRAA